MIALALAASVAGAQEEQKPPVDPFTHVSYFVREHDGSGLEAMDENQLGVDESLEIHWDENAFLSALATGYGVNPGDGSLVERIGLLEPVVAEFVESQAQFLAMIVAMQRAVDGGGSPFSTPEAQKASDGFSKAANRAKGAFGTYRSWLIDQGLQTDANRVKDALNAAATGTDYSGFASAVQQELASVQLLLAERIRTGVKLQVNVRARLHSRGGDSRRLHVNGYDKIAEGEPESAPRFKLGVDDRVRAEFQAAKDLGEIVEKLRDGTLKEEIRAAKKELIEQAKKLAETLKEDVLEVQLKNLLKTLEASAKAEVKPLIGDVRRTLDLLKVFRQAIRDVDKIEDIGPLLELAKEIEEGFQSVINAVRDLPSRLDTLLKAIEEAVTSGALAAQDDATKAIKDTIDQLGAQGTAIATVLETFKQLKGALGLSRSVTRDAQDVVETPRTIDGDGGLDTAVHMLTAGERTHSDLLVIEIEVLRVGEGGSTTVIAKDYRRIRLRMYGVRFETRGALFLVDPRSSVSGSQSWEPVPSISYVLHHDWGDSEFMNDVLDPGLALSLSIMDFSDTEDLEVGAGISLTLFKDLLWFGYGRDIQAEVDYAYVGVNPLLIGDLWSQNGISPSPK